jgi:hypothetical protein
MDQEVAMTVSQPQQTKLTYFFFFFISAGG